jgi:hypothetical protein
LANASATIDSIRFTEWKGTSLQAGIGAVVGLLFRGPPRVGAPTRAGRWPSVPMHNDRLHGETFRTGSAGASSANLRRLFALQRRSSEQCSDHQGAFGFLDRL